MLRLLAQRGEQGYEDLAALMGIEVGEVHSRALEAAAQLESEGIPAPAVPPPPGADVPASPPPPSPEPPPAPTPPEPAVPAPPEPTPTEKPAAVAAKPKPKHRPPPRPSISLPAGGGARAAIAAGVLVVIALVLVLALGGGEDSGDTGEGDTTASGRSVGANGSGEEVTQAVLDPVDGSDAEGVATFGRIKNSLALQVEARGLEPTATGQSYTIWLYESAQKMLPLASTRVGKSGKIGAQVEVPTEVLGYLANETFDQIDISLTSDATLKASLTKATREKKAPVYTGTDVLRGRITGPIIGAAKK